jgi:hypothetical protein
MAKGFTTVHLLQGKEPLLRQMVCEVRFRDGHLYLDHTGRLLKKLINSSPEWVLGPQPNPSGTVVFNLAEGIVLNFSMNGASLDLNKTATDEFIEEAEAQQFAQMADEILGLVFDELEAKEWSRIGFRELYYFPFESKADTERWLSELGVFSVSSTLADSFKGVFDAIGLSLVLEGEECSYRIGLNGVERPAQVPIGESTLTVRSSGLHQKVDAALKKAIKKKRQRQINPAFAAVLDIDAYRKDPAELDVANFIQECTSNNLERFRSAIPAADGKKEK